MTDRHGEDAARRDDAPPVWDSWSADSEELPDFLANPDADLDATQQWEPVTDEASHDEPVTRTTGADDPWPTASQRSGEAEVTEPVAAAPVGTTDAWQGDDTEQWQRDDATEQWTMLVDDSRPTNPRQRAGASAVEGGATTPDEEQTEAIALDAPTETIGSDGGGRALPGTGRPLPQPGEAQPEPKIELPHVERDQMVAGRYRLEEQLVERDDTLTWRAFDTKLSRAVLVHVLSPEDPRKDAVLKAAKSSAVATDSRFLRVLDAVSSDEEHGTYIVCEYVPGISLETMLRQGPLSALEAAWVIRELADALTPMHAQGLFHGELNPDTVVITATGNVKIVGFLIDAALARHEEADWRAREETDVAALGRLFYASLVSRWPTLERSQETHWGLQPAPADHQGWLTPRQVRAGVSPALDAICDQILHEQPRLGGQPLRSTAQIDRALSQVLGTADAAGDLEHRVRHPQQNPSTPLPVAGGQARTEDAAPTQVQAALPSQELPDPAPTRQVVHPSQRGQRPAGPDAPRPRPPRRRPWLTGLVAAVFVTLVVGLIGNAIHSAGKPGGDETDSASTTPTAPTVHPIAKVDDFDPETDGGNGEENPNQVALAWDKKPNTAWQTLTYYNKATFAGLKPGVGLVVDLGQPVEVGQVKLILQGTPTAVQLRVPKGDPATTKTAPMKAAAEWTAIASVPKAGTSVVLKPKAKVTTRYLLVYITSLPNVGSNKYRAAIAEIEVTS